MRFVKSGGGACRDGFVKLQSKQDNCFKAKPFMYVKKKKKMRKKNTKSLCVLKMFNVFIYE